MYLPTLYTICYCIYYFCNSNYLYIDRCSGQSVRCLLAALLSGAGLSAPVRPAPVRSCAMKRYCLSSEFADLREQHYIYGLPGGVDSGTDARVQWYKKWPVCWNPRDKKDRYPVCNGCWKARFMREIDQRLMTTWWEKPETQDYFLREMFDDEARKVRDARNNGWDDAGPYPFLENEGAGLSALPASACSSSNSSSTQPLPKTQQPLPKQHSSSPSVAPTAPASKTSGSAAEAIRRPYTGKIPSTPRSPSEAAAAAATIGGKYGFGAYPPYSLTSPCSSTSAATSPQVQAKSAAPPSRQQPLQRRLQPPPPQGPQAPSVAGSSTHPRPQASSIAGSSADPRPQALPICHALLRVGAGLSAHPRPQSQSIAGSSAHPMPQAPSVGSRVGAGSSAHPRPQSQSIAGSSAHPRPEAPPVAGLRSKAVAHSRRQPISYTVPAELARVSGRSRSRRRSRRSPSRRRSRR